MLYDILWLLIDQTLSHMSDDNDPFSYFRIDNHLFINAATDLSFLPAIFRMAIRLYNSATVSAIIRRTVGAIKALAKVFYNRTSSSGINNRNLNTRPNKY